MGKKLLIQIAVLLVWGVSAFAGGYPETYGAGFRAVALGGAFTAVADDFSTVYYNPAGLGYLHGHELQLGTLYTKPDITVDTLSGGNLIIPAAGGSTRNNPSRAASKGINLPQLGGRLDVSRIANIPVHTELALSLCFPENFDVAYRLNDYPPDQPHALRYGANIEHLTVALGLGVEVLKDLVHLGLSIQSMIHGPGSFELDQVSISPDNQNVVSQAETCALRAYEPVVGLLVTPTDKIKIGLCWREKQEGYIKRMPVHAQATIGNMALTIPLYLDVMCFFTPEEWSAGISYDGDSFMLSLQADKQIWSDFRLSGTDRYHYAEPGFDDTINLRAGLEYKLSDAVSLMAGYCRQPSPAPSQDGVISNYIDADKNIFSAGASMKFEKGSFNLINQPMTLTGVVQYQQLEDYTVNKDGVTGITWVDQESYKVEGNVLAAGVSVKFAW